MTITQPTAPIENAIPIEASPIAVQAAKPFLLRIPWYGWAGAALNIAAWIMSWARLGEWDGVTINGQTYLGADIHLWGYTFFPLWLGFILVLDALNVARSGTSPLRRSPGRFALLFALSVPFWWAFELLNWPVQNWHYRLDHQYTALGYNLISSIDFSTVLPAVLEIA